VGNAKHLQTLLHQAQAHPSIGAAGGFFSFRPVKQRGATACSRHELSCRTVHELDDGIKPDGAQVFLLAPTPSAPSYSRSTDATANHRGSTALRSPRTIAIRDCGREIASKVPVPTRAEHAQCHRDSRAMLKGFYMPLSHPLYDDAGLG
jgi:hypothetical protein